MQIRFRPSHAPGVPRKAFDLLLGFALGAAFGLLLEQALSRSRVRRAGDAPVDDHILRERVRNALAQTIADPRAVDLRVHDGTVILKGPATGEQIAEMIACASRVRGVLRVDNRLSPSG